ncbi:MAG: family efflux transporter [Bacteroidetes bacterium]|jgi:MATE family multidrug resistance protein|nr:family efflux transporter [Bacteroidota bacterium]
MLFKTHIRETILLSLPLIVSQVGHIVTGMVDNMFLGGIGKTEQAAGILASNIFILLLVFSIGMSYALTPLVSQAHVKGDAKDKAFLLKNGMLLNFVISLVLCGILYGMTPLLHYAQQPDDVVELAIPYFGVLILGIVPCSLFFTGKQFSEGLNNTVAAMLVSVAGNILNIILNYLLIHGKFGFPELGYMGACWATFYARCFMGLGFIVIIYKSKLFSDVRPFLKQVGFSLSHCLHLFRIGIGSALQFTFEVAAFAISGLMTGWFGKEQIDAHGIALSIAAFTYMFSSGIGGAATIRVGKFSAQNDFENVKKAGNAALLSALSVTLFFALVFFVLHTSLPLAFSRDAQILAIASELLIIAGFFQLFDGIQVVALGILRGLEDVKLPTIFTLIGYWIICLPLSYYFGTTLGYMANGIWCALLCGLFFVSVSLYFRYNYLMKKKLVRS